MADTSIKKPREGQVQAAAREDVNSYFLSTGNVIENPNYFFSHATVGTLVDQVEEMEDTDPILSGLARVRVQTLLALPREITGTDEAAQGVRECFGGLPRFRNKLEQILECIKIGFSVTELVWGVKENKWWIYDLLPRDPALFKFKKVTGTRPDHNYDDELRLITTKSQTDGIKTERYKFAVCTYNEKMGNRYGRSLYQKIYWYWFLKRNALNFWSIFIENFVTPIVVAKGTITDSDTKADIDDFIENIRHRTGIRLPNTIALEFVQAKESGAATYQDFVEYLDRGLAIGVLGQSSTVDGGRSTGSYAKDKVREQVTRKDILGADVTMLETMINDYIIRPFVDFNWGTVASYPKFRIVKGQVKDMETMLKVIIELAKLGLPITKPFIYETFGIPVPQKADDVLIYKPPPGFAPGQGGAELAAAVQQSLIAVNWWEEVKAVMPKAG